MITKKNMLFLLLLILATPSEALEQDAFTLQKLTQLPALTDSNGRWLTLTEQPQNTGSFYLANTQGLIYQLGFGESAAPSLLFDLKQIATPVDILKLTAFTLHPNFSKRGSVDFGKFFTAHVEKFAKNTKTQRIMDTKVDMPLTFDAVITQWQLNPNNTIDLSSQHEILRTAIADVDEGFQQVSFNPHSKSWHDDFAQLYIALSQSQSLKDLPIYSGAIFRIIPPSKARKKKFYTIPKTNPYYANSEIEDALYVFGAGKIKQFTWPNKHSPNLLISHQYPFSYSITNWLSLSEGGEDWRKTAPQTPIYKGTEFISSQGLLSYTGQNVPKLRKKLLLLKHNNQQWHLSSMALDSLIDNNDSSESDSIPPPLAKWSLKLKAPSTDQLAIYPDNFGEIIIFNKATGVIYQVFQKEAAAEPSNLLTNSLHWFGVLISGLVILIVFWLVFKRIKRAVSLTNIARKDFAHMTLTDDNNINLFRRHSKKPSEIIPIADVVKYEVCLGTKVIASISQQPDQGFNLKHEIAMRELFRVEQIGKMVGGKVRRINVVVSHKNNSKFSVCLYFRQGCERITKKGYFNVVDDVINWCWLIAGLITPEQTGTRPTEVFNKTEASHTEECELDNSPLHAQAAVIRPATHPAPKKIKSTPQPNSTHEQSERNNKETPEPSNKETDLVYALEKLVTLQQQGFLTALEFKQAKAKLLDGFTPKL